MIKQNVTSSESTNDVVANLARDFPNDADKRMDAYLMHKIGSYLSNHAISIKLFDPKTFDAARNFNVAALGQLGVKEEAMESGEWWLCFSFNLFSFNLFCFDILTDP